MKKERSDKMYVQDLFLEITRKCNLKCAHCLRGNAQNKSMSEEIIQAVFRNIKTINTLTIAGGEPSLAINILNTIRNEILWNDVDVQNIFLVTNGKRLSKPLLKAYDNIYKLCSDNSISAFCISNDMYHQTARGFHRPVYDYQDIIYAQNDYDCLSLPEDKIYEHTRKNENMRILARGRAKEWGDNNEPYLDCLKVDNLDEPESIYGEMYVCYNGDVVGDANMCYNDMKKYIRGNVLEFDKLIENIKKSTVENYKWCLKNCDCNGCCDGKTLNCSDYNDIVIEQIVNRKLYL